MTLYQLSECLPSAAVLPAPGGDARIVGDHADDATNLPGRPLPG
jgi:hypothetical protein